jgi:hypothetical protein
MNIALGAVVIFILLIPPIAFYLSFTFVNRQPKAGPKFSLLDGILASAIISLFVHAVAVSILDKEIRFDIILKLLGGELKDIELKVSNKSFSKALKDFAVYNFCILFISLALGRIARWLVISFNLNNGRYELTRLNNRWYYLFNGYENNIPEFDMLFVDAVVNTNDGTIIYSGFLVNYVCNGEQLDRIYLGDVVRREFKRPSPEEKGISLSNEPGLPMNIPGNIFSLSYDNAINLNLRFIVIENNIDQLEQLPVEENMQRADVPTQ